MNAIKITDAAGRDRTWPFASTNATMKKLEEAFRSSLGSSGRLSDHRASLAASKRYTEQGVAAEAARFAKNELLPGIARGHVALQQAKRQLKDRYSQLKPRAADKSDMVGFLKRDSIRRDSLMALSREQRDSYLTRYASELDPEVLLAALEHTDLPWEKPEQRFISDETRAALTRQLLAAEHGDALAELEQIEQAIKYVEPTLDKARTEIQANIGLTEAQFADAARAEAKKTPPIWLKQMFGEVKVVVPNGSARTPTEDELATGVYFTSFEEYQAAMQAAA